MAQPSINEIAPLDDKVLILPTDYEKETKSKHHINNIPDPSLRSRTISLTLTEEGMKRSQKQDKKLMNMIPIFYESYARKKGDWIPQWDTIYLTMDGIYLRIYDSKAKCEEVMDQVNEKLITTSSTSSTNISTSSKRYQSLTVTGISKESAGRPHGLCISTLEKKRMHLAMDTETERVVWVHLLTAALNQHSVLMKNRLTRENERIEKKRKTGTKDLKGKANDMKGKAQELKVEQERMGLIERTASSYHHQQTLLGTSILVNLVTFYDTWGLIEARRGSFADLLPSFHPNITITSNLPPSVVIAGDYYGRAGVVSFFTRMHEGIDVSHYKVDQIARKSDLAVVSGWETVKSVHTGRKFRHLWKHELRFERDGRISHLNILADKTAAAVAFGVQANGPQLELPFEQEESAPTCPPGELQVVCIAGRGLKRRKSTPLPSAGGSLWKVVVGLNHFPHAMTSPFVGGNNDQNSGSGKNNTEKRSSPITVVPGSEACLGSRKSYSTNVSKSSHSPLWTETLRIPFSGAVPGTAMCLFIEVWNISVLGDELVGATKVNLASHLGTATGTKEQIALSAIPKWYELHPLDWFQSAGSHGGTSGTSASSNCDMSLQSKKRTNRFGKGENKGSMEKKGRLQLSIRFLPRADYLWDVDEDKETESEIENEINQGDEDEVEANGKLSPVMDKRKLLSRMDRKSYERLQELHERTTSGDEWSAVPHHIPAGRLSRVGSSSRSSFSSTTSEERPTPTHRHAEEMYTFTVASTKFRVYRRYELIRAIGHGAYGVVIAASDQITGNSVAIKNIPRTFDDLVDAKRIVREIRLMRHLYHPNIICVLDVMRPPSLLNFEDTYIVTDLMETDLHRVINSQESLSIDHVAYITYQLLCALRYMHSAHIIHRDIKPSNILINRDCLVKVCDFGLARGFHGEASAQAALTEYVVTRWYRAPELLLASKYTTAIDLWAVGCIMVELFTRKALFPGHDHVHQLHLIIETVGFPASTDFITNSKARKWMARQSHRQISKSLQDICGSSTNAHAIDLISKLLQFDPKKRISIDEAISHPFLALYRQEDHEQLATEPFDFSFEESEDKLDQDALRALIFEDVCAFHPEARPELEEYLESKRKKDEILAQAQMDKDMDKNHEKAKNKHKNKNKSKHKAV